jgi:hypothetical protein
MKECETIPSQNEMASYSTYPGINNLLIKMSMAMIMKKEKIEKV